MIIELTQNHNGQHKSVWINSLDICFMEIVYRPDEVYTKIFIRSGNGTFGVMETPDEIMELIKQYK